MRLVLAALGVLERADGMRHLYVSLGAIGEAHLLQLRFVADIMRSRISARQRGAGNVRNPVFVGIAVHRSGRYSKRIRNHRIILSSAYK